MSYQSIDMDLDEKIIVKIDNSYYEGNIFLDDGMIAVCKFGSYLVEMDVSNREKINLTLLFDLFEDEFAEVYEQIIEFYDKEDFHSLAEDITKSISNKKVRLYCNRIITQMADESELEIMIECLNQLIEASSLSPSEIPLPEHNCIYHATRSLFFIRGRRSRTNPTIRRFTIAKKILQYLKNDKFTIRLEFIDSQLKVLFHVSEEVFDGDVKLTETKNILSNGDGSVRINIPRAICEQFMDKDIESKLYIRLKDDLVEFVLTSDQSIDLL